MRVPSVLSALLLPLVAVGQDDGFKPLFDGRTLAGWVNVNCAPETWSVRDGLNGKEVSGGSEWVWRNGYIGLESEGGPVDWRNLRIKELPPSAADAEQSAPPAEPWQNLYDGRTLRGWRAAEGWKTADWKLRANAGAAPLANERELANFDLQLDWSWDAPPAELAPPLAIRAGAAREIALPALGTANAKGWNRLTLTRRGALLTLQLNGASAGSLEIPDAKLTFALRPGRAALSFANLFVQ